MAEQFQHLLSGIAGGRFTQNRPFAFRFWDDSTLPATDPTVEEPAPTFLVTSPRAIAYMLRAPDEVGFGRAWIAGDFDFEGDLSTALSWRTQLRGISVPVRERLAALVEALRLGGAQALFPPPAIASEAHQRGRLHSLARDRAAISHHYDVSNDFYRLILGPSMVYSCAYFASPEDSLEEAQRRKLELICQKLALQPGDRLLDIGCGWGSLLIHAALEHGIVGVGVTLSDAQARLARQRIAAAGVEDQVRVEVRDYRELAGERFDAIASVGMYEHVGRDQLGTYVRSVRDMLEPGGRFLNHGITQLSTRPTRRHTFVNHFVFPDGDLNPLDDVLVEMHEAGLEVRDVESLREHYALTLRHWVANLADDRDAAIAEVGTERERIWRLYMIGSATAFALADISIFQTLAVRGGAPHRLPLKRAELIGDLAGDSWFDQVEGRSGRALTTS